MKRFARLVILIILSIVAFSCVKTNEPLQTESNQSFFSMVGGYVNTGLLITTEKNILDFSEDNWIHFFTINGANESIEFSNIFFSLQVFQYNSANSQWIEIKQRTIPMQRVIILPPGDKFGNLPDNQFSINTDYLDIPTSQTPLRFFISGVGVETGKIYGAYVDVDVKLPD